jgi:hypothetical protein
MGGKLLRLSGTLKATQLFADYHQNTSSQLAQCPDLSAHNLCQGLIFKIVLPA